MASFGWAYIGSGSIAKSTARNISKGGHHIVSVYSRNMEKATEFANKYHAKAYATFDEAVTAPQTDGVYIATPHTSHLEYSLRAMALGKPVLCEKPVGVTAAEAKAMLEAAQTHQVYFCEAMWTWFSDVALTVKQWIQEERIGVIQHVHIDYAFPGLLMSKTSRVLMPETAGGALLDIGIYPISYCYHLFGYPQHIDCKGIIKGGIDTQETVTLTYDDFTCTLEMSLSKAKEGCRIIGTKGEINIPMFHMAKIAILKTQNKKEFFRGKTDYLTQFNAVAAEIRAGKIESDFIPPAATLDCLRIIDECRRQIGLVYPFEAK